jgi:hypothetical protein
MDGCHWQHGAYRGSIHGAGAYGTQRTYGTSIHSDRAHRGAFHDTRPHGTQWADGFWSDGCHRSNGAFWADRNGCDGKHWSNRAFWADGKHRSHRCI